MPPGERSSKKTSEQDDGGFRGPTDSSQHSANPSPAHSGQSISKGSSANLATLPHPGSSQGPVSTSSPNLGPNRGATGLKITDFSSGLTVSNSRGVPQHGQAPIPQRPLSGHELTVRSHPSYPPSHRPYHSHGVYGRTRGYDSDTGYRSDTHSEVGYRSDTGYRLHRGGRGDGYSSDFEVMARGRGWMGPRGRDGYASDLEGYVGGRRQNPNMFRPLGGHPNHNMRPPAGSHRHHGMPPGGSQKNQVYSNAPFFRRTNIKNDELYEQQCMAQMPSHPPSKSSSLRTLPEVTGRGRESPSQSNQNVNQSCTEDKLGSNDDEMWKAQLYKASVKLQKTPSDRRKKMQVSKRDLDAVN